MEKNSSQYSSVKAPQSKVGKITVWGVCGVKSVWTGDKTLVVGGLKRVQRCLELQYLRYQERESCSFLHQLLLPARSCFHLLTCFPFFLLLFFWSFPNSSQRDRTAEGLEANVCPVTNAIFSQQVLRQQGWARMSGSCHTTSQGAWSQARMFSLIQRNGPSFVMKMNNPWKAPGTAKISILSTDTPQCSLFIF